MTECLNEDRRCRRPAGECEHACAMRICPVAIEADSRVLAADRETHPAEPAFDALRALTEALLTQADDDYLRRQIDAAVKIMADHGCTPPVPWPDPAWGIARWGVASEARAALDAGRMDGEA